MFIRRWGVQHRCSIWTLPLFQSWGFWPQILHQTAVFLNAERDMLLDLNKFPVPRVGNLTMLKKFTCRTFALNPPPPSLSKDWHLHNDNIFLIIFALAEFTNRIQSYPRMCLHHCHKNRFLPILLFVLLLSKVNNINPLSLLFTQNKSCIIIKFTITHRPHSKKGHMQKNKVSWMVNATKR